MTAAVAAKPRNVSIRHASRRVRENSHATIATTPGKKYGTNPK